jgi:purine-binding chemotaxis protein CheW
MTDLLLIVRLAGRRIAIPAGDVEAVVELEAITPVARSAPHVAGLSALRSRVLTVIDCLASLEQGCALRTCPADAIVVPFDGHLYALLVDRVEDVVEPSGPRAPLRARLAPGWARVALGMVEAEGDLLLLVDPHALLTGPVVQQTA